MGAENYGTKITSGFSSEEEQLSYKQQVGGSIPSTRTLQ